MGHSSDDAHARRVSLEGTRENLWNQEARWMTLRPSMWRVCVTGGR